MNFIQNPSPLILQQFFFTSSFLDSDSFIATVCSRTYLSDLFARSRKEAKADWGEFRTPGENETDQRLRVLFVHRETRQNQAKWTERTAMVTGELAVKQVEFALFELWLTQKSISRLERARTLLFASDAHRERNRASDHLHEKQSFFLSSFLIFSLFRRRTRLCVFPFRFVSHFVTLFVHEISHLFFEFIPREKVIIEQLNICQAKSQDFNSYKLISFTMKMLHLCYQMEESLVCISIYFS